MCPACIPAVAVIAASSISTGGLTALIASKLDSVFRGGPQHAGLSHSERTL